MLEIHLIITWKQLDWNYILIIYMSQTCTVCTVGSSLNTLYKMMYDSLVVIATNQSRNKEKISKWQYSCTCTCPSSRTVGDGALVICKKNIKDTWLSIIWSIIHVHSGDTFSVQYKTCISRQLITYSHQLLKNNVIYWT